MYFHSRCTLVEIRGRARIFVFPSNEAEKRIRIHVCSRYVTAAVTEATSNRTKKHQMSNKKISRRYVHVVRLADRVFARMLHIGSPRFREIPLTDENDDVISFRVKSIGPFAHSLRPAGVRALRGGPSLPDALSSSRNRGNKIKIMIDLRSNVEICTSITKPFNVENQNVKSQRVKSQECGKVKRNK